MSWRRLGVLVRHLPPDSALARETFGADAAWGLQEHLLAVIADHLAGANWQRAGKKGAPRPKPVQRPGLPGAAKTETFRGRPVPLDEMKRRFAERRAQWMAEAGEVS